jgi:hypothetical protein
MEKIKMEEDYIKQIELLKQLDSFNLDIEKIIQELPSETNKNILKDARKYINSRKKYYELRAREDIDKILYDALENKLKGIKYGSLLKASYLKPKIKGVEINTPDVIRILKRNKSGLEVVRCDIGFNTYWVKPSALEIRNLMDVDELAEKLKEKGGYGNEKQVREASQKVLKNITTKGFSEYSENYFLERERTFGNILVDVVKMNYERGSRLIKDVMDITGLLPGTLNNKIVMAYHPKIIRQLQF